MQNLVPLCPCCKIFGGVVSYLKLKIQSLTRIMSRFESHDAIMSLCAWNNLKSYPVPPLLLVDVVYCVSMWVKKYSVLYLSSQNPGFIFLSSCHPPLLPSSFLLWAFTHPSLLPLEFSTNLHLSALLPLQVLPCPSCIKTDSTRQIVRKSRETQNMAVAGCPDYFLHHPNYQVNSNFL